MKDLHIALWSWAAVAVVGAIVFGWKRYKRRQARALQAAIRSDYHLFKRSKVTCRECDWAGLGADMGVGEVFEGEYVTEYRCPKCGEYWGVVPWPEIALDTERET